MGAMFTGWVLQALAKLAFAQRVPLWPLRAVRAVSGMMFGSLIYLWLFQGLFGGFGGGSGSGFGGGAEKTNLVTHNLKDGKNAEKSKPNESKDTVNIKEKEKTKSQATKKQHYHVVVDS